MEPVLDWREYFTPPKQEEFYGELSKVEILTKMLNSIDHFDTASGSFEMYYANSNTKMNIDYELSISEPSGGYVKTNSNVNGETFTRENSYQDVYFSSAPLSIDNAFSINEDGDQVTESRWYPPIEEAANSLFPYDIASNYTRELASWEIENQNENVLDHNAIVILGQLNSTEKTRADTFRFWVDKDSGVLIKYETYNKNGEIVDYLHPSKLEINQPVDTSKFKKQ